MIEVRDLEFAYGAGGFRLRVAALDIADGEAVALLGPSGCGKTTLAHLIAGILTPSRGTITVAGVPLAGRGEGARRAFRLERIGLVFQRFELLDYLPVLDNILLPSLLGAGRDRARARRDDAVRIAQGLGLGDKLRRHPEQLSQGERQRVAIGRALLNDPEILIADEPTGNLDPDTAAEIMALIWAQVRARGRTFLMVTHDHGLLAPFDRVVDFRALTRAAA